MSEMPSHFCQRQALRKQVRSAGVSKAVRTGSRRFDLQPLHAITDHSVEPAWSKRSMGSMEPQEEFLIGAFRTHFSHVALDCVSQRWYHRADSRPALFGKRDSQRTIFPVHIAQPDAPDLSDAHPINGQQQQDRTIPYVVWMIGDFATLSWPLLRI